MSEYWKSTPSYWCKFCSQYVRDTPIERKNHEATARHQNNIQRSLRELHKNHEREKREKQRAKDEVARLNGMFGSKAGQPESNTPVPTVKPSQSAPPAGNTAAQRRAHAEQLAALGVELPEELKKEVTGVGSYHVVSERTVEGPAVTVNRSLADILAETRKREFEVDEDVKSESSAEAAISVERKRKADDDEDFQGEEAAPKRRVWGNTVKSYPGADSTNEDASDLDALLGGIKKKEPSAKPEKFEDDAHVKEEEEPLKSLNDVPDVDAPAHTALKQESSGSSTPAVVFKKRKGKK